MSNAAIKACWPVKCSPNAKLVLFVLADHADKEWKCWPSISTLVDRTCSSKSSVIRAIVELEAIGVVSTTKESGRSTMYQIHNNRCQPDTGVTLTPVSHRHRTGVTLTPDTIRKKPKETIKAQTPLFPEKVETPKTGKSPTIPDWVPAEAWAGYLGMRKRQRKAPTDHAIDLLVARLDAMRKGGHDPGAVLDQSTANSWIGLFPIRDERERGAKPNLDPTRGAI